MVSDKYVLDGTTPRKVDTAEEWARGFSDHLNRHVGDEMVGEARISTVFLGVDHNFLPNRPPLLFETMIFGGVHDGHQTRASTYEEAKKQHAEAVALVRALHV